MFEEVNVVTIYNSSNKCRNDNVAEMIDYYKYILDTFPNKESIMTDIVSFNGFHEVLNKLTKAITLENFNIKLSVYVKELNYHGMEYIVKNFLEDLVEIYNQTNRRISIYNLIETSFIFRSNTSIKNNLDVNKFNFSIIDLFKRFEYNDFLYILKILVFIKIRLVLRDRKDILTDYKPEVHPVYTTSR